MRFLTHLLLSILLSMIFACNGDRPEPPDGWRQKINNELIGRVTLEGEPVMNCARTRGRHVICQPIIDSLEYKCYAIVSYLDNTPTEMWEKACPVLQSDTLIFDDGKFSYFYGTKSNP